MLVGLAALLTACPGPQPPATASIVITSHQDGQVISGNRQVFVSATVTGMANIASYTITLNGAAVAGNQSSNVLSATIDLVDHVNVIGFTATSDQGKTVTAEVTLDYPFVTVLTYQAATVAIGQEDLTSLTEADSNEVIAYPAGRAAELDGHLYLSDRDESRVMVYDTVPTASGQAAGAALGQDSFAGNTGREGAGGLHAPGGAEAAGNLLVIADGNNSRVLIWHGAPAAFAAPADVAVGQAGFSTNLPACSATSLDHPGHAALVNGKLVVADTLNNRVLIWNAVPTTSGAAADVVLGQTSMTSCAANAGGAVSGATMLQPKDVWSDGRALYVADTGNNRVLVFAAVPTVSGASATFALGQPSLVTSTPAAGQQGMVEPSSVHGNANQVLVADTGNNRVLIWNYVPTSSGAAADLVLGQADFDDVTADAGQLTPHANGLNAPLGVAQIGDDVVVADTGNRRYVVYEGAAAP